MTSLWDNDTKFTVVGNRFDFTPETLGFAALGKQVLLGKGMISRVYHEGYSDVAYDMFLDIFKKTEARQIYDSIYVGTKQAIFVREDTIAEVGINTKQKFVSINMASTNDDIVKQCRDIISTKFTGPAKKGHVYAIMKNAKGNLELTKLGYAGAPLERANYSHKVIEDYDYVVADMNSKDPYGRVVVLDGSPGNGKTFMTRSFLMDVPNAMFVIVPPNMVASIGGPDLLPLLLKTKESSHMKGPIVLILEDADQCLAPRESDNISSISAILNLGDGIFGSVLDVRIIATTNAKAKDIDPAITRDGRLSKRINIAPLAYDDADTIFRRLTKNEKGAMPKVEIDRDYMKPSKNEEYTLARVYKLARDAGWKPAPAVAEESSLVPVHFENEDIGMPDMFDVE